MDINAGMMRGIAGSPNSSSSNSFITPSYIQKLWMRAEAAYPGDEPDHPPYTAGVDTPCKNIL
jgi:hypothetical protein